MSDKIFVFKDQDTIEGLVTLYQQNNRGQIDLTGVNSSMQGKGIGSKLANATKYYFISQNINVIDVVTQKANAQAIDSYYKEKPLGSFGQLATFSFHETKNIISGEGGMLVINDDSLAKRVEIIWEKGTNRSAFFRGEVDKYGWVDTGSSFLPS